MGLDKLGKKKCYYSREQSVPTLQKQVAWVSRSKRWSLPALLRLAFSALLQQAKRVQGQVIAELALICAY